MKHLFFDDYSEGAHPDILKFIADNNLSQQAGYCNDEFCKLASDRIKLAFGVPGADVYFLPNGTIANVIGLSAMLKPFEGVVSPASGHINTHEAGALEAAGHKIIWVDTPDGKMTCDLIDKAMLAYDGSEHTVVPRVLYLTQATEQGSIYNLDELTKLIDYSKSLGLLTFIDGARLAMALACSEAKMTMHDFGNLDVDMFYIGGTKNGGIFGEAMVVKNNRLKPNFKHYMKQRGGLMAKGRFMGQQFARFFDEDNLWLELGRTANAQAAKLRDGLLKLGVKMGVEAPANQLFPIFSNEILEKLSIYYGFYKWSKIDNQQTMVRLVCSWATPNQPIDDFLEEVKHALD